MSHEPVVTRCETVEEAAAAASEVLATAIASARTVRGRAHVALSGGSVVGQTYRMLGGVQHKVTVFQGNAVELKIMYMMA